MPLAAACRPQSQRLHPIDPLRAADAGGDRRRQASCQAAQDQPRCRCAPIPATCRCPTTSVRASRTRSSRRWRAQLGAEVSYFWRPYLERGLTRETFANNECHILLDMPADSSSVLTTHPDLSLDLRARLPHADKHYDFKSLDDPRLKNLKSASTSTPPSASSWRATASRTSNRSTSSRRTRTCGRRTSPGARCEKVVDGKLDVVGVWGPFAGWLKKMKDAPLTLQPVNLMEDESRSSSACRSACRTPTLS